MVEKIKDGASVPLLARTIVALVRTMRPRQWTKNIFVFAAIVFDRQLPSPRAFFSQGILTHTSELLNTLLAFVLFCLLSSAVYIINDITDLEADRRHPQKRNRPLASGQLSVPVAAGTAAIILVVTLPIAFVLSPAFFAVASGYFLLNLAYSVRLKHIPLIDVMVIAAGFVLRVAAGVTVIVVERFSPWLYVTMTLLALYLGFGKRRAELATLAENANSHRRVLEGYNIPLLDQLITIVSSTTIITYSLYTFSAPNVPENHTMMLTIPFVIYAIFRYLYLIQIKQSGGEPEELLLSDRPLQISIALWVVAVLVIFYLS